MKNQRGFSMMELLVVFLVLMILVAIAIPNVLSARRASNEASAVASLRNIHGAQVTFFSTAGAGTYACVDTDTGSTAGLATLLGAKLIDDQIGSGTKSGYNFRCAAKQNTGTQPATFFAAADPVVATSTSTLTGTGVYFYATASDGVIYRYGSQLTRVNFKSLGTVIGD